MTKSKQQNTSDWSIIFQPLDKQTHQKELKREFVDDVEFILMSSAYVNLGGVESLIEQIKAHSKKIEIFIGIGERNSTTSRQALDLLLDTGIKVYVVNTNNTAVIFHPKVYLFSKEKTANLIVGSANLTHSGLHNNIEVSVCIGMSLEFTEQRQKYDYILNCFNDLKNKHNENCFLIENKSDVESLLLKGLVVDESLNSNSTGSGASTSKNKGKAIALPFVAKGRRRRKKSSEQYAAISDSFREKALCWIKKKIPEGDLQLLENGNASGVIRLVKSGFKVNDEVIDQRTYFRKNVFAELNWAEVNDKEEAIGVFKLTVMGENCGFFNLKISHKPSWESKQKNYTTGLHVSPMKQHIQKKTLINKRFVLYKIYEGDYDFEISIE